MSIRSAARVIRPGGAVSVWHGVADPQPTRSDHVKNSLHALASGRLRGFGGELKEAVERKPKRAEVETYSGTLEFEIPKGAIDPFHFEHPTAETVLGWLEAAGLEVEEVNRPFVESRFIRARRAP